MYISHVIVYNYFVLYLYSICHLSLQLSDKFDQIMKKDTIHRQMKELAKFHYHLTLFYDLIKWPTTFYIFSCIYGIVLALYNQTIQVHRELFPISTATFVVLFMVFLVILPDIPKRKVKNKLVYKHPI